MVGEGGVGEGGSGREGWGREGAGGRERGGKNDGGGGVVGALGSTGKPEWKSGFFWGGADRYEVGGENEMR